MLKHFTFILKVKDCDKEFKEGLGKGVLVEQKLIFNIKNESDLTSPMFVKSLLEYQQGLIERVIEVEIIEGELENN